MLRITIEVIPFADVTIAECLGTLDIVNDLTGTRERGNYLIFEVVDGKPGELVGEIEDYDRGREFWHLVRRALKVAYG